MRRDLQPCKVCGAIPLCAEICFSSTSESGGKVAWEGVEVSIVSMCRSSGIKVERASNNSHGRSKRHVAKLAGWLVHLNLLASLEIPHCLEAHAEQ